MSRGSPRPARPWARPCRPSVEGLLHAVANLLRQAEPRRQPVRREPVVLQHRLGGAAPLAGEGGTDPGPVQQWPARAQMAEHEQRAGEAARSGIPGSSDAPAMITGAAGRPKRHNPSEGHDMSNVPQIQERAEQHYAAIPVTVTMAGLSSAVDSAFPELFGWLAGQGIAPAGPPLIRYLVIDMAGTLQIELGVPVAAPVTAS